MAIPFQERRLPLYRLAKALSAFILCPFFKIHVSGHANIPVDGPFLMLPKHQRWEDVPLLSMSIARPLYYVAKHELFQDTLSRWLLSSLGGLPLNRSKPSDSIQSVKKMLHLLKKGEGIVIFPEGTYYRERMGEAHKGLARMILSRCRAPLIPVGINYSKTGQRVHVRIEIGRPVYTKASGNIKDAIDLAVREIAGLSGLQKYHIGENTDDGT